MLKICENMKTGKISNQNFKKVLLILTKFCIIPNMEGSKSRGLLTALNYGEIWVGICNINLKENFPDELQRNRKRLQSGRKNLDSILHAPQV